MVTTLTTSSKKTTSSTSSSSPASLKVSSPINKEKKQNSSSLNTQSKTTTTTNNLTISNESVQLIENEEEKKKQRLLRNRSAAQKSREKKKAYIEELEFKFHLLSQQNVQLSLRVLQLEDQLKKLSSSQKDEEVVHFKPVDLSQEEIEQVLDTSSESAALTSSLQLEVSRRSLMSHLSVHNNNNHLNHKNSKVVSRPLPSHLLLMSIHYQALTLMFQTMLTTLWMMLFFSGFGEKQINFPLSNESCTNKDFHKQQQQKQQFHVSENKLLSCGRQELGKSLEQHKEQFTILSSTSIHQPP